jgi:23S rRNA pseudouridine2457 synthase
MPRFKYYAINKPFNVLSQFTDKQGRKTLKDFFDFSKDIYPIGRLDRDSEGLLLLTNDRTLTDFLLNPKNKHEREYLAQIEGIPREEDLKKLEEGLIIEKVKTLPAKAKKVSEPGIWKRIPPVRERKSIPHSWLRITLVEGRNRQVRKMTAKIGYPTLRLIRVRIRNILLGSLIPGKVRELSAEEIRKLKMP